MSAEHIAWPGTVWRARPPHRERHGGKSGAVQREMVMVPQGWEVYSIENIRQSMAPACTLCVLLACRLEQQNCWIDEHPKRGPATHVNCLPSAHHRSGVVTFIQTRLWPCRVGHIQHETLRSTRCRK